MSDEIYLPRVRTAHDDVEFYRDAATRADRARIAAIGEVHQLRAELDQSRAKFKALQRLNNSRDREVRNDAYEHAAQVAAADGALSLADAIRTLKEEQ